jgi:SAM-dependent methyltransferase
MPQASPGHNSTIVDFQSRRSDDCAAFLLPYLDAGMTLLDIGCGPGTITAALASAVRSAIGIDKEPKAIARADTMARDRTTRGTLRFLQADMTALPFADSEIDAVFFHAVLYHLDAAMLANTLAEARRVLKPGGLVGVRDSDVGGNILYPETPGLLLALDLWARWYQHADPHHVRFGRRQSAVLRSHGFTPIWSGASFVNHSADAATRRDSAADAKRSLEALRGDLAAKGLATDDDIHQALEAWDVWGADPDSIYLRCRCECVAVR